MNQYETVKEKKIYYVYFHRHPETKEIVYIGHGSGQRAWMMRSSKKSMSEYGHRNMQHFLWFKDLETSGYTLQNIVSIKRKGLSKKEAANLEKVYIKKYKPIFNKQKGVGSLTNIELIRTAKSLRNKNLSYGKIANEMNLKSNMTAWRYVNNDIE